MAILEKEVWVTLKTKNAGYFEELGYYIPKNNNRLKHGTKILVKVRDLPESCHVKLTKICDMPSCGVHIPNQSFSTIINSRKKGDGKDRCEKCGHLQKWNTRKNNIRYEQSLEHYAICNDMNYLLNEFSSKNNITPDCVFKASINLFLWNCPKCSSEYEMTPHSRTNGKVNCPYCAGRRVNETNCLWTTNPEIAKLLKNKERGYEINAGVNKKEVFVCKDCGFEQSKLVTNVVRRGFNCSKCGDGLKYPEKFTMSVLDQLNISYEIQKKFDWSDNKKYDFYIDELNNSTIIETHGIQHYEESFTRISQKARTFENEKLNDQCKMIMATMNNIKNYIVVDCRESNLDYIKNSLIKSNLSKIYNLDEINWKDAHIFAIDSNLVKKVCDLWEIDKIHNTTQIGKIVKLSRSTVCVYLKRGNVLGWCNYDPKETFMQNVRLNGRKVGILGKKKIVQLTKDNQYIKTWDSAINASKELEINKGNISSACTGKVKSAGGFKWMFKEDYEKQLNENLITK